MQAQWRWIEDVTSFPRTPNLIKSNFGKAPNDRLEDGWSKWSKNGKIELGVRANGLKGIPRSSRRSMLRGQLMVCELLYKYSSRNTYFEAVPKSWNDSVLRLKYSILAKTYWNTHLNWELRVRSKQVLGNPSPKFDLAAKVLPKFRLIRDQNSIQPQKHCLSPQRIQA